MAKHTPPSNIYNKALSRMRQDPCLKIIDSFHAQFPTLKFIVVGGFVFNHLCAAMDIKIRVRHQELDIVILERTIPLNFEQKLVQVSKTPLSRTGWGGFRVMMNRVTIELWAAGDQLRNLGYSCPSKNFSLHDILSSATLNCGAIAYDPFKKRILDNGALESVVKQRIEFLNVPKETTKCVPILAHLIRTLWKTNFECSKLVNDFFIKHQWLFGHLARYLNKRGDSSASILPEIAHKLNSSRGIQ